MVRDFYSERIVRARRPSYCRFCQHVIFSGERHVFVSSCSTGVFSCYRAHVECQEFVTGEKVRPPAREITL